MWWCQPTELTGWRSINYPQPTVSHITIWCAFRNKKSRNVWPRDCWPAAVVAALSVRVFLPACQHRPVLVSTRYCRSRDQPTNVCRKKYILRTSLEYMNQDTSFSLTTNHGLFSKCSLSHITPLYFSRNMYTIAHGVVNRASLTNLANKEVQRFSENLLPGCYPDRKTGDNGNVFFPWKDRISKIPAKRFLYRSLWAQIFKKKFQTFQKPRKK